MTRTEARAHARFVRNCDVVATFVFGLLMSGILELAAMQATKMYLGLPIFW